MNNYRFPRVPLAIALLGGLLVILNVGSPVDNGAARAEESKASAGSQLYSKYCLACHGADGSGSTMKPTMPSIPDFTSAQWHDARSTPELTVSILEGKGTQMPSFSDRLTSDESRDLVNLIRSFKKAGANTGGE